MTWHNYIRVDDCLGVSHEYVLSVCENKMFNSAAIFFGRRCSSQLDIPTLWIKEEDDDEEQQQSSSTRGGTRRTSFDVPHQYHTRRLRHSLPSSTVTKTRRTSVFVTPPTPSTALAASPISPDGNVSKDRIPLMSMNNEVRHELPILNPIFSAHHRSSDVNAKSILGNIFTTIGVQKQERYFPHTIISTIIRFISKVCSSRLLPLIVRIYKKIHIIKLEL